MVDLTILYQINYKLTQKLDFMTAGSKSVSLAIFEVFERVRDIVKSCIEVLKDKGEVNKISELEFGLVHPEVFLGPVILTTLNCSKPKSRQELLLNRLSSFRHIFFKSLNFIFDID